MLIKNKARLIIEVDNMIHFAMHQGMNLNPRVSLFKVREKIGSDYSSLTNLAGCVW